jgi:hypothetical protein
MGCIQSSFKATEDKEERLRDLITEISLMTTNKIESTVIQKQMSDTLKEIARIAKSGHFEHLFLEFQSNLQLFYKVYPELQGVLQILHETALNEIDSLQIFHDSKTIHQALHFEVNDADLDEVSRSEAKSKRIRRNYTHIKSIPQVLSIETLPIVDIQTKAPILRKISCTYDVEEQMSSDCDYGFFDMSDHLYTQ